MSEETTQAPETQATLPLIVLDGAVVFPDTVVSLPLDDDTGPVAEAALKTNRLVLLAPRRADAADDAPLALQLHRTATIARIEQSGTLPNGISGIVVRGLMRASLGEQTQSEPYLRFGYAAAISVAMFLMTAAMVWVQWLVLRRWWRLQG